MNRSKLTYPDVARLLGTTLISTGIGLLLFVAITVVWGDPFTSIANAGDQKTLQKQLAVEISQDPGALQPQSTLDPRLTRVSAHQFAKSLREGSAAAFIRIPRIGMHRYVVKGADVPDLAKGPGIYSQTGFPGNGLPVAIAGHRTTHGAPFLNVDQLRPGDSITLELPYGIFTYSVTRTQIILPTDWSIVQVGASKRTARERNGLLRRWQKTGRCAPAATCEHLVLTACHPKYSAARRIAVFADLTSISLRGGAKQ